MGWHLPLKCGSKLKGPQQARLYDRVADLTAYFAAGAPATLTTNIRPERGLANGTLCQMQSVYLDIKEPQTTYAALRTAKPGEVVMLVYPPYCVNVSIGKMNVRGVVGLNTSTFEKHQVIIPLSRSQ